MPIKASVGTLLAGDAGDSHARTCPGKTTHRGDNSDNEDNDDTRVTAAATARRTVQIRWRYFVLYRLQISTNTPSIFPLSYFL